MAELTKPPASGRAAHEIEHGELLARRDPETAWGWGTPAGRLRAQRRADLIIRGALVQPDSRVLEVGCGAGNFTELFAASGAQILAVDISPALLERAQARGLPAGRVRFACKRFEECELDGPFDAVIGSSILHHLDIEPALAQIRRLLKPGGYMSFAEPNLLNPQVFAERKFRFMRRVFWYVSPDETAFVRGKFRAQLAAGGFDDIAITPFDWLHPSTPGALIPLVRRVGGLLEMMPLFREFAGSLHVRARRPLTAA